MPGRRPFFFLLRAGSEVGAICYRPAMLRTVAVLVALLPTLAQADVTGPARIIDGDTLEVAGHRVRLTAWVLAPAQGCSV